MGGFNFIFCVAENFIKTVGFDFIVSKANDFIKNSESSTLSTKNIKTSFLYPTDKSRFLLRSAFFFCPQRPAFFIIRNTATMYKTQGLAILLRFVYHGSRETARICRSRRAAGISDAGVNTHHLPSIADKNNKILTAAQGNATIKTNGDATELTYKHSAASSFWIKNH